MRLPPPARCTADKSFSMMRGPKKEKENKQAPESPVKKPNVLCKQKLQDSCRFQRPRLPKPIVADTDLWGIKADSESNTNPLAAKFC